MERLGVWLIGARGSVATTALLGHAAMQRGLVQSWGLTSELPEFQPCGLASLSSLVFGGHEVRMGSLIDQARELSAGGRAFDPGWIEACSTELEAVDREIRPGTLRGGGAAICEGADADFQKSERSVAETLESIREDWASFRQRHGLKRMIVVNLASTEPVFPVDGVPNSWSEFQRQLAKPEFPIPPSVAYAMAALDAGIPHINFTPSTGSNLPALRELAILRGVCHAGCDGKTGETLLKSVLAPMFAHRNLEVMSWVGHNLIGNNDGRVLDDPANKASKVKSKDRLLGELLGYAPQTHVSIEYIRSLGDWKTAWDHIHFRGFLGAQMTMQFTWQGCDSALAAPLVLDLVRFTDWASRAGETGELGWLACFFKSPQGCVDHDFSNQFAALRQRVLGASQPSPTG